jgi:hypothetical protein
MLVAISDHGGESSFLAKTGSGVVAQIAEISRELDNDCDQQQTEGAR